MKKYIKSPLNYMGGKFKLLNSIIPLLPSDIDNFVDLFAGGLNVGINVKANKVYANDHIVYLAEMYDYFLNHDIDVILEAIDNTIDKYNLTKENKEGYLKLRRDYNESKKIIDLFVLTCFSFNHQIRFNNKHEFNVPFGKNRSSYNPSIKNNLIDFILQLQQNDYSFSSKDFSEFDFDLLHKGDVVYCDPPYLITNASYNDGKRGFKDWTSLEERQLLDLLDELNSRGIKFMLSNVFYHKGNANELLINWSQNYRIIYVDKDYSNCNYHIKDRNGSTVEVIVTNIEDIENNLNI